MPLTNAFAPCGPECTTSDPLKVLAELAAAADSGAAAGLGAAETPGADE
jgi:hypothetical protein